MPKLNTPTQSTKYHTEDEMPYSIRTSLSAADLTHMRFFLDANGMKEVKLGYYSRQDERHSFMSYNQICYAYSKNDAEMTENMTCMILRYGSLENAFKEYMKENKRWR